MNEKPFICRTFAGLRPGQWLMLIGVIGIAIGAIKSGTVRPGQVLIIVGGIGYVVACFFSQRE